METLTVISGSGEMFELALHGKEEMDRLGKAMKELTGAVPEERRQKILGVAASFFPQQYRKSLQDLSRPDAAKLASALAECCRRAEKNGKTEDLTDNSSEDPADTLWEFSRENPVSSFSDRVIAAAFYYKWSLEYAAALPEELLERCLRFAGGDRRKPEQISPVETLTPEEIAQAAVRGAAAVEKLFLRGNI